MEQARYLHEDLPPRELPEYLHGLEWPATKDDAIVHAAEHGAPHEVLEFMERLPAAVFTSEEGMRHAFSALDTVDLRNLVTLHDEEEEAEDGLLS
jgi:uncharacterized protein DUF2795